MHVQHAQRNTCWHAYGRSLNVPSWLPDMNIPLYRCTAPCMQCRWNCRQVAPLNVTPSRLQSFWVVEYEDAICMPQKKKIKKKSHSSRALVTTPMTNVHIRYGAIKMFAAPSTSSSFAKTWCINITIYWERMEGWKNWISLALYRSEQPRGSFHCWHATHLIEGALHIHGKLCRIFRIFLLVGSSLLQAQAWHLAADKERLLICNEVHSLHIQDELAPWKL